MNTDCFLKTVALRAVTLAIVVAVFVGIFLLTAQSVQDTSALSNFFFQLFGIENVRKWAHSVEFFVFGCSVTCAALVWFPAAVLQHPIRVFAGSLIVCVAGSLFDQTHKLFVPGREFDVTDFPFDIFGYVSAILLVALAWYLLSYRKHTQKL